MSLRTLVVCALLAAVEVARAEEIELKNGDTLTCEIIEVTVDHVVIEHAELGVLDLERAKVKTDLQHRLAPGLFGTGFMRGWNRHIDLGFNGSQGNTISTNITGGMDFSYKDESRRWGLTGRYFFQRDETGTTDNNARVELRRDWFMSNSPWFAFGALGYQYDEFESWNHRSVLTAGPGYHLLKREKLTLDLRAAPAFAREFGVRKINKAEALFAVDATWKPRERMTIKLSNLLFTEVSPDAGQLRNVTFANWKTRILSDPALDLIFGADNEYETQVEDGDKKNSLNYYMTLGISF